MWKKLAIIIFVIFLIIGEISLAVYGIDGAVSQRDYKTIIGNVTECDNVIINDVKCLWIWFDYEVFDVDGRLLIFSGKYSGFNRLCTNAVCPNTTIFAFWNIYTHQTCLFEDLKCPPIPGGYLLSILGGSLLFGLTVLFSSIILCLKSEGTHTL